jgi:polyphosphate kinase 2
MMTDDAQTDPKLTASDSPQAEAEALHQEDPQLAEENAQLPREERKAVKRYHREQQFRIYQAELVKFQQHLEETNERMLILCEGRDAAGKGGTIRRVTRFMNPRHYRVVALGRPTEEQRNQWFLQKYVAHLPTGGEIVLFDRSWYNRAMVEPVLGFCSTKEYDLFMHGVVGFEKDLVRQGTTLIKLYFSVSKKEQARRFARRKHDPLRQWKLSEADIQAQERWDEFTEMKYKMLRDTHTSKAPWTIVRSDNKRRARLNVMKVILDAVPYKGRDIDLDFVPDPKIVISGAREIEIMRADCLRSGKFTA